MKPALFNRVLAFLMLIPGIAYADARIATKIGDQPLVWTWSGRLRTGETFWGKNISLLNNANIEDRLFYMRHTFDLSLGVQYGLTACDETFVDMLIGIRNKGIWGSSTSIAQTTDTEFKILDSVGQSHRHFIPRHILWIREAWLRTDVGELLKLSAFQGHSFTIGAFSFQLGRGISLGDAYAVSPDYLGFFTDSAVDQYAFGLKLAGDIVEDKLTYELYGAYLNNLASSLAQTGERVHAQIYGQRHNPVRGFAKINYVFAAHLFWTPLKDACNVLTFEPYIMYNNDPEQKIEVLADAESKLATFGFAAEFVGSQVEWGFDAAFNRGNQLVKGIDRNVIEQQNRNGRMVFVNSHVLVNANPLGAGAPNNLNAYKAPQSPITVDPVTNAVSSVGSQVQNVVYGATQSQTQNGQKIGNVPGYAVAVDAPAVVGGAQVDDLFNAKDRFRDPYVNKFTGWMWVMDAATYVFQKEVKLAMTAGIASGDEDPNFIEKDGVYGGFIPLQSVYAGKRVRSAFILGSAGKLRRPLAEPEEQDPNEVDDFAALTSDFTNLAFIGGGLTWAPREACRKWSLNPNVIAYWRQDSDKKFDFRTKRILDEDASNYLGLELNLFYDVEFIKNFKFFLVASAFIPGQYYHDIRGKPLNASQEKILDRIDPTGFTGEAIPGIGTNTSYTLNFGFEFKF
jgi:hypothetical protein